MCRWLLKVEHFGGVRVGGTRPKSKTANDKNVWNISLSLFVCLRGLVGVLISLSLISPDASARKVCLLEVIILAICKLISNRIGISLFMLNDPVCLCNIYNGILCANKSLISANEFKCNGIDLLCK